MVTPKEYASNLKKKIITENMLKDALYSVNKRAKNYRDQKRKYKYDVFYNNAERAEANEERMYARKDKLLTLIDPICIHREHAGYERIRVYDYEPGFVRKQINAYLKGLIVWQNSYLDYDTYQEVSFFDFADLSRPKYRYYLYRTIGGRGFHTPIVESALSLYSLPVVDIENLLTFGDDIADLLSVQFVDKLITLIDSGEYTFVRSANEDPKLYVGSKSYKGVAYEGFGELVEYDSFLDVWREYKDEFVGDRNFPLDKSDFADVTLSEEDKSELDAWMRNFIHTFQKSFKRLPDCLQDAAWEKYSPSRLHADKEKIYADLQDKYDINADLYDIIAQNVRDQVAASLPAYQRARIVRSLKVEYVRKNTLQIAKEYYPERVQRYEQKRQAY